MAKELDKEIQKELSRRYVVEELSIKDLHKETGIPLSTIRWALLRNGVLRTTIEASNLANSKGKLGSGLRGKKRPAYTEEHIEKIRAAKLRHSATHAKGVSLKPNGYLEITKGPNKGKGQHVAVMEAHIGRPLAKGECIHHIDFNRQNNNLDNLRLMTRSTHSALHRKLENELRRAKHGIAE